jgi:hypothetical protein
LHNQLVVFGKFVDAILFQGSTFQTK